MHFSPDHRSKLLLTYRMSFSLSGADSDLFHGNTKQFVLLTHSSPDLVRCRSIEQCLIANLAEAQREIWYLLRSVTFRSQELCGAWRRANSSSKIRETIERVEEGFAPTGPNHRKGRREERGTLQRYRKEDLKAEESGDAEPGFLKTSKHAGVPIVSLFYQVRVPFTPSCGAAVSRCCNHRSRRVLWCGPRT